MTPATIEKAYLRRQIDRESAVRMFDRIGMNGEREVRAIDAPDADYLRENRDERARVERMFR